MMLQLKLAGLWLLAIALALAAAFHVVARCNREAELAPKTPASTPEEAPLEGTPSVFSDRAVG